MRYELVKTADGTHARMRDENGNIVWWTENYADERDARAAIDWAVRMVRKPTHDTDGTVIATAFTEVVPIIEVVE